MGCQNRGCIRRIIIPLSLVLTPLLAVCLLPGRQLLASAPASPSTLWVGEEHRLVPVPLDGGSRTLDIPVRHLEDVAVDAIRGVVWTATTKELIVYDRGGAALFHQELRPSRRTSADSRLTRTKTDDRSSDHDPDDPGEGRRKAHLSLDPSDGSVWFSMADSVIRFSADRRVLITVRTGSPVEDLAVDGSDGSCWVGMKRGAAKYASDGRPLLQVGLEQGNELAALAADPVDGSLWIGTKKGLLRFDRHGQENFRTAEPRGIVDLKLHYSSGMLWAVTGRDIVKYERSGKKLLSMTPCPPDAEDGRDGTTDRNCVKEQDRGDDAGLDHEHARCEGRIRALAVEQGSGSCFVAWNKAIVEVGPTGDVLRWIDDLRQIEAIDIGVPGLSVTIASPADGTALDALSVPVSGTVSEPAARITVNGREARTAGRSFEALEV